MTQYFSLDITRLQSVSLAIYKAAGPWLLEKCQNLNSVKKVFHTVRARYKRDNKLNNYYKICLKKVLGFNVKSIVFC